MTFAINQRMDAILSGKPINIAIFMFPYPACDIACYTCVKSPIAFAGQDIDTLLSLNNKKSSQM